MTGLAKALASGDWLDARVRAYFWILVAMAAAGIVLLGATSDGLNDYLGRPLGTDFSNIYVAGKYVLDGKPAAPFTPELQHLMEKRIFGPATPFYGWHYPPVFLAIAALLALLPYLPALIVWQAATLALYLASIRAIVAESLSPSPLWGEGRGEGVGAFNSSADPPHPTTLRAVDLSPAGRGEIVRNYWLPALAFPAVFINIAHGHNGFLTAALFGGGLLLLDRRPVISGVLLGLLCYKPQFGILIPLALAAGSYWRAFIAAGVTVAILVAASWLTFGAETWAAFRDSLAFTQTAVLEEGGTGFHKIQSLFAALRAWHAPLPLAYGAQALLAIAVAVVVVMIWRSGGAPAPKAAALLSGALLVTPYVLDYDLMVMAPAIAFLAAHGIARGFLPWEKTALAAIFIAPLVTRAVAEYTGLPIGFFALAALFLLSVRRAYTEGSVR